MIDAYKEQLKELQNRLDDANYRLVYLERARNTRGADQTTNRQPAQDRLASLVGSWAASATALLLEHHIEAARAGEGGTSNPPLLVVLVSCSSV